MQIRRLGEHPNPASCYTMVIFDLKVNSHMNISEFLTEVVRPNVAEQEMAYTDQRKAFNAIAAVDALSAYLFHWCEDNNSGLLDGAESDLDFRNNLALENPSFELLRDLAKANKHMRLTRGSPRVSSATQSEVKDLGWDEASWDSISWDQPRKSSSNQMTKY